MKALIINDTGNSYHWGCYGTSTAIKEKLKSYGISEIFTFSCEEGGRIENAPKKSLLIYSKNKIVRELARLYYISYFRKKLPALWESLTKSDCVVINGEGTINSIHVATRFIFFMIFLAKDICHKKVYLINHSCYPKLSSATQIYYYKCAYSRCDFISAREKRSYDIISNILSVKAEQAFDSLPLLVKSLAGDIPNNQYNEKYVCLSGAVNYNKENSSFIAFEILKKYKNHKIIYLVGSPSGMNNEEPEVIESLKKHIPQLIVHDSTSFTEWLSIIKNAVVLISGRYHYSIAAMCFGTPTVCFSSNTPKLDEINKMFNLPECVSTYDDFIRALNEIEQTPWHSLMDEMSKLAENNYNFLQPLGKA